MIQDAVDRALYADDAVARDRGRHEIAQHATVATCTTLIACLDAPQRLTRRRAAAALSDITPTKLRRSLVDTLSDQAAPIRTRVAVARVLVAQAQGEEPALVIGCVDPEPRVRRSCMTTLTPIEALLNGLRDSDQEVVARCAQSLLVLETEIDPESVRTIVREMASVPSPLVRLLARVAPDAPELAAAHGSGYEASLDHLRDRDQLRALADSDPVTSAWGLSRIAALDSSASLSSDPRVRAAAARCPTTPIETLRSLIEDPDAAVRWYAERALAGDYAEDAVVQRLADHARLQSPSAFPPYGLRPDDILPDVERVHAAVALCQARFDINLGVAMRSAEAAGLEAVYFVGRGDFVRSPARGADLAVPVHHQEDTAALIRTARHQGYQIVAIQQTAGSVPYHRAEYPPNPLFVVGAEDVGMPADLRAAADLNVEIPQYGIIDSLNVATALTVVVFHWRAHLSS